jgi:hypothetical protein
MEISFCDRCHESIPDVDLETGKAVRIGGKMLHVPCAFRRAMPGPGRTLLTLLTLLAAGGAAYSVVRLTGRDFVGSSRADLEARWRADDRDAAARLADAVRKDGDSTRAGLQKEIETGIAGVVQQTGAAQAAASSALSTLEGRIAAYREEADRSAKRQSELEMRLEKISAWVEDVRNLAARSATPPPSVPSPRPADPQPIADVPPPAAPKAPPVDPKVAAEKEAELRKWIEKLKDPDPSTSFSATYKLMDLNDLRAVGPLVDTLKTNKDYYTRLGAASALGKLHACDGVPALLEALDDREELVQTAAADALQGITGHDAKFVPGLTKKERRAKRDEWTKFWKDNEPAVRGRFGQEKTPDAPGK